MPETDGIRTANLKPLFWAGGACALMAWALGPVSQCSGRPGAVEVVVAAQAGEAVKGQGGQQVGQFVDVLLDVAHGLFDLADGIGDGPIGARLAQAFARTLAVARDPTHAVRRERDHVRDPLRVTDQSQPGHVFPFHGPTGVVIGRGLGRAQQERE